MLSRYLGQKQAQAMDAALMKLYTGAQLMELAGLSCAQAVHRQYFNATGGNRHALVLCGPGNNGGDGLVCARHLALWGWKSVQIWYPVRKHEGNEAREYLGRLTRQVEALQPTISFVDEVSIKEDVTVAIDAMFGFSFSGSSVRAPFDNAIKHLNEWGGPVAALDVPSGWDVEKGDIHGIGIKSPAMLISLTAPKLCAKTIATDCLHFAGGRFVPLSIALEFQVELPVYENDEQIVQV